VSRARADSPAFSCRKPLIASLSVPVPFSHKSRFDLFLLGVLLRPMASVTTRPPDDPGLARVAPETIALPLPSAPTTVRIEPPRGWLELHLHEVWQYRGLLYFFVWRDVKVRYKQTVIGIAWVVLQPLMTMGVFTLFFGRLARLPSDGLPYPVFYFAALVPWTYFSTALQSCTSVVVGNQHVITKVYFPRLVLPLSAVVAGLVDFAIGFVVLLVVTGIYGIKPTLAALWLAVLPLLAVLTALGVGLRMSALQDASTGILFQNNVVAFDAVEGEVVGNWYGRLPGVVRPRLKWKSEVIDAVDLAVSTEIDQSANMPASGA